MAVLANAKVDLGDAIDALTVSDVDQESGLDAAALWEGELFEDRAATRQLAVQRLLDHAEFGEKVASTGRAISSVVRPPPPPAVGRS